MPVPAGAMQGCVRPQTPLLPASPSPSGSCSSLRVVHTPPTPPHGAQVSNLSPSPPHGLSPSKKPAQGSRGHRGTVGNSTVL